MMERANRIWRWLLELLYPGQANCLGCGDESGADEWVLCADCADKLSHMSDYRGARCLVCGRPIPDGSSGCRMCRDWPEGALDMALSAYIYRLPADALIRRLKYQGVRDIADTLGSKVADTVIMAALPRFDVVVPVPMHARRLRLRGLNHAELIADAVARDLKVPLYSSALTRIKHTRHQAKLSRRERMINVNGAFAAAGDLLGKRVLLVDDVLTTGATAINCAKALKDAGAEYVCLGTVASAADHS